MKNLTWVEFPLWLLISPPVKLTTLDFELIARISSKTDKQGRIHLDDILLVLHESLDNPDGVDVTDRYKDYLSHKILFLGEDPANIYLNFADQRQEDALFGKREEKDDEITRVVFPLEILKDNRLEFEQLKFLSLCFEMSKLRNGDGLSFIDGGAVYVLSQTFNINKSQILDLILRLESFGYVEKNEEGLRLLP